MPTQKLNLRVNNTAGKGSNYGKKKKKKHYHDNTFRVKMGTVLLRFRVTCF